MIYLYRSADQLVSNINRSVKKYSINKITKVLFSTNLNKKSSQPETKKSEDKDNRLDFYA